jgi:hypothetical protein
MEEEPIILTNIEPMAAKWRSNDLGTTNAAAVVRTTAPIIMTIKYEIKIFQLK